VLHAFEVQEKLSPLALARLQKEKRQRVRPASKKPGKNNHETDW
jgi:hypothetical protein